MAAEATSEATVGVLPGDDAAPEAVHASMAVLQAMELPIAFEGSGSYKSSSTGVRSSWGSTSRGSSFGRTSSGFTGGGGSARLTGFTRPSLK